MSDLLIAGLILLAFLSGLVVGVVGLWFWIKDIAVGPRF